MDFSTHAVSPIATAADDTDARDSHSKTAFGRGYSGLYCSQPPATASSAAPQSTHYTAPFVLSARDFHANSSCGAIVATRHNLDSFFPVWSPDSSETPSYSQAGSSQPGIDPGAHPGGRRHQNASAFSRNCSRP